MRRITAGLFAVVFMLSVPGTGSTATFSLLRGQPAPPVFPRTPPPFALSEFARSRTRNVVPSHRTGIKLHMPLLDAAIGSTGRRRRDPLAMQRHAIVGALRREAIAVALPTTTTGINPWWTYEEGAIPGIGRYLVNVANGNLIVQKDDVDIPVRGVDLAFRRTYNAQSAHDYANTDGSVPSNYGNGWTNTFDAHLGYNATTNVMSVYDTDGARYDYTSDGNGGWVPPAGQHAIFALDGSCYYAWTKKSGTTYLFYRPTAGDCITNGNAALAGRLAYIFGRNQYNWIRFDYSFVNGDGSTAANLTEIDAVHSSGMKLVLTFASYNGKTLLQTLTKPDANTVTYTYDDSGNLTQVNFPGNDLSPQFWESYGYGIGSQLAWIANPRFCYSWFVTGGNPTEGMALQFAFSGNGLSSVTRSGFVNVAPSDGTNTLLQPGLPSGRQTYLTTTYSGYGTDTVSVADSDGHATNWVVDALGRVTQRQQWTGSVYLKTDLQWDAQNNLIASIDPRGEASGNTTAYQTNYAYDANGNTVAVAQPGVSTVVNGAVLLLRATTTLTYDQNNNVLSFCDPQSNAVAGRNWDGVSAPPACPTTSGSGSELYTWAPQLYEPYGELTSITTPLGYTKVFSYAPSAQRGLDFGLPTSVAASNAINQNDGTQRSPAQVFTYDNFGNLTCYSSLSDGYGTYWWRQTYDGLNRRTAVASPDDAALQSVVFCPNSAPAGLLGSHDVTRTSYNADGTVATTQTPSEYAVGVSTAFTHDEDGNTLSETHHHNCTTSNCPGGVTTNWFDGDDRLIETRLPYDTTYDAAPTAWSTRYLYDLSQNHANTIAGQSNVFAHGNLYKTQEYFKLAGQAQATWHDAKGNAFDALDRQAQKFYYVPGSDVLASTSFVYDGSANALGFLSSVSDALGYATTMSYDSLGRMTQKQYSDGKTPTSNWTYDADGRAATRSFAGRGIEQLRFDADGRLITDSEGTFSGFTSPATLTYSYYADGLRSALSVQSQSLTQTNLVQYAYRSDGEPTQTTYQFNGQTYWARRTFTGGHRPAIMADTYNAQANKYVYDNSGQLSSLTLPQGALSSITHDAEGNLKTFVPAALGVSAVSKSYSTRGELVQQNGVPCYGPPGPPTGPGYRSYSFKMLNGAALPQNCEPYNTAVDLYAGAVTEPYDHWGALRSELDTQAFGFDADGRQVTSTTSKDHSNQGFQTYSSYTRSFDAENHLIQQAISTPSGPYPNQTYTYIWGPNDHPEQYSDSCGPCNDNGTASIHWDGDTPLFATDSNGTVLQVCFGYDVCATTANGFDVLDRDFAGVLVGDHSAHATSAWNNADDWASTTSATKAPIALWREDGVVLGSNTFQGVRSYNPDSMQWTTPDAYAGEVGDPMSQRAYMWNRNNPVRYSDPTGYETACAGCLGLPSTWTPGELTALTNTPVAHFFARLMGLEPLCGTHMNCGAGPGSAVTRAGRAAEYLGGEISESGFLRAAENYLGAGYRDMGEGRFLSKDGMRQVRFGEHETRNPSRMHAHFEAYDLSAWKGGRAYENTRVRIMRDPRTSGAVDER